MGGYNPTRKQWRKGKKGYLFNAFALAKVWRARVLDATKKHPELSRINSKTLPKK